MIKNDLELIQEQIEPVLDSENRKTLDEIQFIRREGGTYAKKGNFSTLSLKVGTEKVRNLLKSLYPRFTLTEIEKITGIPDSTLERWFNVLDIPFNAFHCSIVSIPSNKNKEYSIGKYKVISKKRLIRINIHKPSWPDWLSEIGMHMHHSKKRKVVNEILNLFGGNQNDKDLRN